MKSQLKTKPTMNVETIYASSKSALKWIQKSYGFL